MGWQCTEPLSSWVGIEAVHAVVWHSNTDIPAEGCSFDLFGKFTVNRFVLLYNVFTTDMDLADLLFVWHVLTIAILKLKPITIRWKKTGLCIAFNWYWENTGQNIFPTTTFPPEENVWYGRVKYVTTLLKVTSEQSYVFYDIWNGTAVQSKWLGSLLSVELIIIPTSNWIQ